MNDWPLVPLGELTENFDGRRVPVKEIDRKHGPYPYYGASGIVDRVDGYIFDGEYLLIGEDGENLRTRQTPISFMATGKFWVNNHAHIVRGNHRADTQFLNYVLSLTDISGYLTGSTMPKLTQGNLNRLPVITPPLAVQKAIAAVLGALDDKIELNRRMNATLEAMARALFQSWFIDFDPVRRNADRPQNPPSPVASRLPLPKPAAPSPPAPLPVGEGGRRPGEGSVEFDRLFPDSFEDSPLGHIPTGWETSTIGAKLQTVLGGTPSRAKPEYWTDGTVAWINSGKTNEFRIIEPSEWITKEALENSATKLLPRRTTVLAITGATLGQVSITEIECCANQSVVAIPASEQFPTEFIYPWIEENIDKLIASQTGGAQQHINKGNVEELALLCPDRRVVAAYQAKAKPLFDQIAANCFQSRTLATLRDTLLPRLLSGEMSVAGLEFRLEAVS